MSTDSQNCLFCKIVAGTVPCYKVYEDELFLGFLDIFPAGTGHTLLVPKKHFRWVHDVEPFGQYWETARVVMRKIEAAMNPKWMQYGTHGEVPHAHIHIIPRYDEIKGAPVVHPKMERVPTQEEFEETAKKIVSVS